MPASRPGPDRLRVQKRIEALKPDLVAFTKDFCRIATVNPPGNQYLACAKFLEKKLHALGMKTRLLRVPPKVQAKLVPGLDKYPRYNLIARWDVGAKKTLHYTGHYDVVPPTSGWKTDPFAPYVRGDKLIGRGTVDMKACDAASIFAVQALMDCKVTPPWNLELSFTADEETGGYAGLGWVVKSKAIKPDAAVLLEGGSGEQIGYAHRGVLWLNVTVIGRAAHASNPKAGINALEKACALIRELQTLEPVYAKRRSRFQANKMARRPTMMIGGVSGGGGKINTIPDRFTFSIDRRLLPEDDLAAVKAEIMRVIARAQRKDKDLKVEVAYPLYVAPGWTDPQAAILKAARAAHTAVTGRKNGLRMTGGFTDMHWLTNDGKVPTVGYGCGGAGAHSDFEWVGIRSMVETCKIYAEIALRMPR
ncbi:MAG: ArgE/DapE family deacylase [Planctomycetota bacterium]|nr:ArgE/DapE family deacylase [Planctomycetota bacterium]